MKKKDEGAVLKIRIYLDDNIDTDDLIKVLKSTDFEVISPRNVGMSKKKDHQHLAYASLQKSILITRNCDDFRELHKKQKHYGILLIYRYNNQKKDMNEIQIAKAIKNLINTGVVLENNLFALNQYNY